jgi:hypothetical protein
MDAFLKILVFLGGALAALAVAGMCLVSLVVWVAGLDRDTITEAWRRADES